MTATWRKKLRSGSFRGVPFFITGSERGGGRRLAKHEFPGRNIGYTEDLGRKIGEYPVEVFVSGDDYMSARDALITACNADGPGTLIHPYYGTVTVTCESFHIRETGEEGGKATFSITFVEAGSLVYPAATADAASAMATASSNVISAAQSAFANVFSSAGLTGSALAKTQSALSSVTDQVQSVVDATKANYQSSASVAFQLAGMKTQILNAIAAPSQIAQITNSAISLFSNLGFSSTQTRNAYLGTSTFGAALPAINATTAGLQQASANQTALVGLVQQISLANAANAAVSAPGVSYEDAVALRDQISQAIDAQLETVTDDELYLALTELQTQLTLAVPPSSQSIGNLITIDPAQTDCTLVLLYDQFGSIANEADFISRNGIVNPAFVSANQSYQALQNASA